MMIGVEISRYANNGYWLHEIKFVMDAIYVVVHISSLRLDRYLKFTSMRKVSLRSPNGGYILLLLYSLSEVPHSWRSSFVLLSFSRVEEENMIGIRAPFDKSSGLLFFDSLFGRVDVFLAGTVA